MGRHETHGMRALMARMHTRRLSRRDKRTLSRIQRALTANTIEHLHGMTIAQLACLDFLAQGFLVHAMANPDQPLPKQALGILNNWRRTAELLAQLEEQLARGSEKTPSLSEYLAERSTPTPLPEGPVSGRQPSSGVESAGTAAPVSPES